MRLAQFTARNFRNLASLDLDIPEPGVVIIGENAQGKTNFLEAIYYLVLFRSLRGAKDAELARFGEAAFFVGGAAEWGRVTAGYEAATRRKKVTVGGVEVSKLSEAVGKMVAVPFSAADTEIVAGGPARWVDRWHGRFTERCRALGEASTAELHSHRAAEPGAQANERMRGAASWDERWSATSGGA